MDDYAMGSREEELIYQMSLILIEFAQEHDVALTELFGVLEMAKHRLVDAHKATRGDGEENT